jgi:hypothetical protein
VKHKCGRGACSWYVMTSKWEEVRWGMSQV